MPYLSSNPEIESSDHAYKETDGCTGWCAKWVVQGAYQSGVSGYQHGYGSDLLPGMVSDTAWLLAALA